MSDLEKAVCFGRQRIGVREKDGPSYLEASLLEGRRLGKVPVGFVSCFGY